MLLQLLTTVWCSVRIPNTVSAPETGGINIPLGSLARRFRHPQRTSGMRRRPPIVVLLSLRTHLLWDAIVISLTLALESKVSPRTPALLALLTND